MIYGNNVKLETVNGNQEIKCRLCLQSENNAEPKEVSAGLNYWQFVAAAVTVMRKKADDFDVFYFPRRDFNQPLVSGPCDVLEFTVLGRNFIYRSSDGFFALNHQPGKNQLPGGVIAYLGDYYLGTSMLAGKVFGEKLENGCWNISALNEEDDEFETEKYGSYLPASDGESSVALRLDGRYDIFSGGYRLQALSSGFLKVPIKDGCMLFFDDGNAWKLMYEGPDCLPDTFDAPAVLFYDPDSDRLGTLIFFDEDRRYEEHGEIMCLDQQIITVGDKVFDFNNEIIVD